MVTQMDKIVASVRREVLAELRAKGLSLSSKLLRDFMISGLYVWPFSELGMEPGKCYVLVALEVSDAHSS